MRLVTDYLFIFLLGILGSCVVSCSKADDTLEFEEDSEFVFSPPDSVLFKSSLKVLDIGNSYTNDATCLLPSLVSALGIDTGDMCLYKATLGGASFFQWYCVFNDSNSDSYEVERVIGGLEVNVPEGKGNPNDGTLFRMLLSEEDWDIVIVHPRGMYATEYDKWCGNDDSGYLKELLGIIKYYQPKCKIGFLLVHSPTDDYPTNVEKSSVERWSHITTAALRFVQEWRINILIPYGTAIQNLRATSLNNDVELTRDGSHLGHGLAQYTAACCYYESLFAPRTGVSILGKDIQFILKDNPAISQYSVTMDNMVTAQKAAVLACKYPFICLNPEEFELENMMDGQY